MLFIYLFNFNIFSKIIRKIYSKAYLIAVLNVHLVQVDASEWFHIYMYVSNLKSIFTGNSKCKYKKKYPF